MRHVYRHERSIVHTDLRRLYGQKASKGLRADTVDRIGKMLTFLDAMEDPEGLHSLSLWKPHVLTGDREGIWTLHVTRNRRLTFRIEDDWSRRQTSAVPPANGTRRGLVPHSATPPAKKPSAPPPHVASGIRPAGAPCRRHGARRVTGAAGPSALHWLTAPRADCY